MRLTVFSANLPGRGSRDTPGARSHRRHETGCSWSGV